jgi:hypothetical protein
MGQRDDKMAGGDNNTQPAHIAVQHSDMALTARLAKLQRGMTGPRHETIGPGC